MISLSVRTVGLTQIDLGFQRRIAQLRDLRPQLEEALGVVYEATRQHFDSSGSGEWAPLAESTVQRKQSQGVGEPDRELYAFGNLYESATSPAGPYSTQLVTAHQAVAGIDWEENGYQIPQVLSQGAGEGGAFPAGGHGHNWKLPPRHIWPPLAEVYGPVREVLATALHV